MVGYEDPARVAIQHGGAVDVVGIVSVDRTEEHAGVDEHHCWLRNRELRVAWSAPADLPMSPSEFTSSRTADADDAQPRLARLGGRIVREPGSDVGDELVDRDAAPARLGFEPSLSLGQKVERYGDADSVRDGRGRWQKKLGVVGPLSD